MGVPKQKWTLEEEAALKAGVAKYGPGKWSTILKDSEFVSVLHLRSNVDLKDKWRNLNLMASGYGSRQRARPGKSKTQSIHKLENISTASKEDHDMKVCIPDPSTTLAARLQIGSSNMSMPRLDSLILDTIANLKESHGSSRAAIAEYIEEKHSAPPNLEKLLKAELKALIGCGKLIKVKHRYRIAPSSSYLGLKENPSLLLLEVKQEYCSMEETGATKILTKADIDAELEKMRSMTPQQAAAVAVKAVAEAEAAISEAERAEREAQAAEADAELARVFAAAAMQSLKRTALCT
ncbi:telomere repeat-binding factor 1-like [Cynara cardunculus var. scolymus]|uniref:MYB transcription factor n=1 Tax=Cynara cardunculus var. scolymus TaxID=59895 RepID=A0A103YGZ9_CYNCS|nr:telomere repeat-binding factor 1-like [Cynara cardunculus var. scolymus]XP_024991207.1 telomere repeat-binding factor 1-like [Cynara cardunculus var. scolymus]XP_024991216.1 telomere repeat-binding factor 1-like [Cynara cardunculus var. scolymus]XP_024991224.1 telomere repeat-binding factor 1-like [Cynara cardunculus var. scolymus]XP_024991232.1 telomere repeat-binding factor 1-like [Cynara cardunculus var. scolymus]XP_024991241.1 telomere repeat-binding factor 1-like [Cynara cardunculus va